MRQSKQRYYKGNLYFLIPFIIWVIAGGILLLKYDEQVLFAAINSNHTAALDELLYYVTWMGEAAVITLILLILFGISSLRNWWYFTGAALCNLVPTGIEQWLKYTFDAPRPLNYYNNASWIHILPAWDHLMDNSFPSGHSCGAFSFFCFLSLLLPKKFRPFGFLFFILALSVGYSRIYLAAHFFADVYAGSIIGTVCCFVIFYVLKLTKPFFFKKEVTD